MQKRARAGAAALALATIVSGCSASPAGRTASTRRQATGSPAAPKPQFYVSLGDSYAAGYQPTGSLGGHTDRNGFAYQVPALARKKGYDLKLVNFGCSGATTESIVTARGCALAGPGAPSYPHQTQAAAAEAFLKSHRGRIGLITVSIGGNDFTDCAFALQVTACLRAAVTAISKHLAPLLSGVRAAAGKPVPIIGTTYPDVALGLGVSGAAPLRGLAALSVLAFKLIVNPELRRQYEAVGGTLADVTAATGAYGPFGNTVELAPYGRIPLPVAKVCELTFFCRYHDIHPRTAGYRLMAGLVVAELPRHD